MAGTVAGFALAHERYGKLAWRELVRPAVRLAADGIALTDAHWEVIRYLRDEFAAHGHTPNFRNMLKGFQAIRPEADSQYLYGLFPMGPAKQAVKLAGLPQPYGKGGY